MGTTTFSGPIKSGTIKDTTGTTLGKDRANVGFCQVSQAASFTQTGAAVSTGIVLPANSIITQIRLYVTTAGTGTTPTASVGLNAAGNNLVSSLSISSTGMGIGSSSIADIDNWADIGATDAEIIVNTSEAGAGAITITIEYLQGIANLI